MTRARSSASRRIAMAATVYADVVVLAEGVNGLVGQRSGLRPELKPDSCGARRQGNALSAPGSDRESRFNLKGNEGVVIEAMGTITAGMTGTGFLYTNQESISIGIGCIVSDFAESGRHALRPARSLQDASQHQAAAGKFRVQGICGASDSGRRLQGDARTLRRRLDRRRRRRPIRQCGASRRLQSGYDDGAHRGRNGRADLKRAAGGVLEGESRRNIGGGSRKPS